MPPPQNQGGAFGGLMQLGTGGTTTPQFSPTQGGQNFMGIPYAEGKAPIPTSTGFSVPGTTTGVFSNPAASLANRGNVNMSTANPTLTNQQMQDQLSQAKSKLLQMQSQTGGGQNNGNFQAPVQGSAYTVNGVGYDAQGNVMGQNQSGNPGAGPTATANTGNQGNIAPATIGISQQYSGQQAAPGMEWGPDGKQQLKSGMTTNAQGQPASTSQNVTSGGGTQTNFPSIVGGLASTASQDRPEYQAALQDINQQKAAREDLLNQYAKQTSNINASRTNLAEAGGEQGNLQNLTAGKEAAINSALSTDATILGAATSQQGTQQSGLNEAASQFAPRTGVQYGTQTIQPGLVGTGSQTGGGSGVSPNDPFYKDMQTYAQMMANGQMDSIPGSVSGNPALQAQLLQMAKQINPNFNYNQSQATGQSQKTQTQQAQQYTSYAQQAKNNGAQLTQLIQQAGINPSDLNALNSFIQKIATNTSDANYQTFQNLINDMSSSYANVLTPAGGTVTDMVRSISQSLLNAGQSGGSILQVMQNLDKQVQAKIAGTQTAYGGNNSGKSGSGWGSLGD